LSLNGGAIDRPKNVPDGLQNRYLARGPCSLPFQFFDLTDFAPGSLRNEQWTSSRARRYHHTLK
jgi:hypothetical protein